LPAKPLSKVGSKARKTLISSKTSKKLVEIRKITIGLPQLTRFERARIIGARALQLALGAPPFIPLTPKIKDPIEFAIAELNSKVLPISIRRSLPNGIYQDIPFDWLL
jgi:DNA-directed RNA polymerase I, II, and III subunit RPABC2